MVKKGIQRENAGRNFRQPNKRDHSRIPNTGTTNFSMSNFDDLHNNFATFRSNK